MKLIILVIAAFCLTTLVVCAPPCSLRTANTTQPVLIGNIKNTGGKIIDKNQAQRDSSFSISIKSSYMIYSAGYVHGWKKLREGSNKADAELLPFADRAAMDTTKFVKIDQIRFSSWATYLLFYLGISNHGWLDGAVYKENSF